MCATIVIAEAIVDVFILLQTVERHEIAGHSKRHGCTINSQLEKTNKLHIILAAYEKGPRFATVAYIS